MFFIYARFPDFSPFLERRTHTHRGCFVHRTVGSSQHIFKKNSLNFQGGHLEEDERVDCSETQKPSWSKTPDPKRPKVTLLSPSPAEPTMTDARWERKQATLAPSTAQAQDSPCKAQQKSRQEPTRTRCFCFLSCSCDFEFCNKSQGARPKVNSPSPKVEDLRFCV